MMKKLMIILCIFASILSADVRPVLSAPAISATDQDSLQTDLNSDARVNRGDTIRQTITIRNIGTSSATGTNFSDTLDADTTLVSGSVIMTAPPVAVSESYTALGNVSISVNAASGVLANDFGIPFPTLTTGNFTSTNGGEVSINADGSFTYDPPAGFTGNDTFAYTLTNSSGSVNGTVTVAVSNKVWFINNASACSSNCNGRMSHPFTTLAAFNTVNDGLGVHPKDNDPVFIYESSTNYAGPVTLRAGQKLIGQDSTSSLTALTGLTPPAISPSFPVMNSSNGIIVNITSAGNGIILGSDNRLDGFTSGNASGIAISGASVGSLVVRNVKIDSTGSALSLASTTGTVDAVFQSVTSGWGTNNIYLSGLTGSVDLGTGSIGSALGNVFVVSGGSGTVSYSGMINNSNAASYAASITDRTGGTITLSGNFNNTAGKGIYMASNSGGSTTFSGSSKVLNTGSSTAVNLSNNSGHTISFINGGLDIDTSGNVTAFTATGGGTVTVAGSGNSIKTNNSGGTGTALNVVNTAIGSGGLNFERMDVTGASNGIVLNSTGTNGGLTVTGVGTTAGSGGTISNTTGNGISITSARDISLGYMNITNPSYDGLSLNSVTNVALNTVVIDGPHSGSDGGVPATAGRDGINGISVTDLTLNNTTINNVGNTGAIESSPFADGLHLRNIKGNLNITNSTFNNINDNLVYISNDDSGLTKLTMAVSGGTFSNTLNGHGILLETSTTQPVDVTVTGATFNHLDETAILLSVARPTSSMLTLSNNTFTNISGDGIRVNPVGGTTKIDIKNNSINTIGGAALTTATFNLSDAGDGIDVEADGTATLTGFIQNNTIQNVNADVQARGIRLKADDDAVLTVLVGYDAGGTLNTLTNTRRDGLELVVRKRADANVTVVNNSLVNAGYDTISDEYGMYINSYAVAPDDALLCLAMSGNSAPDYKFRQAGNATFKLEDYVSGSVATYINTTKSNTGTVTSLGIFTASGACARPQR